MEIKTGDISSFPPEIRQQVLTQLLIQKIDSYGKVEKVIDGKSYVDDKFCSFSKMKQMVDFRTLDKGCETWLLGEKYPIRQCVNSLRINTVSEFKKLLPTLFRTIRGNIFQRIISILYLYKNYKHFIDFIHAGIRNVYYPEQNRYSQPVRELYRVIKDEKIRDIICAFAEFDTAYRYRLQDILGELNKYSFLNDPIKEIKRLADILFTRETDKGEHATRKFEKYLPYILLFLKFNKKLLNELKNIIREIDIDEVKLSIEDIYWTNSGYSDYNFRGLTKAEREIEYIKMQNG